MSTTAPPRHEAFTEAEQDVLFRLDPDHACCRLDAHDATHEVRCSACGPRALFCAEHADRLAAEIDADPLFVTSCLACGAKGTVLELVHLVPLRADS